MKDNESPDQTITITSTKEDGCVCPFSRGRWKKVGDALVFFMLFVAPFLFLIALLMTGFN